MGQLTEVTFMSLDGVIDAPDLVREAQRYFASDAEHDAYQEERLEAADALLLGRRTYEALSAAYLEMGRTGRGAPTDFVDRMNRIPKYVASTTLDEARWNATPIGGDVPSAVRRLKGEGVDLLKYGTGSLDRVLFDERLVDRLCIVVYPFLLGHGTHLFEEVRRTRHLALADVRRLERGTVILEYAPDP